MAAAVLRLPENLDLIAAAPLRSEFLSRRGEALDVDGSDVQRLGGLCLQVLLSAQAAWAADDQPFRISALSAALRESLSTLGAEAILGDGLEEMTA